MKFLYVCGLACSLLCPAMAVCAGAQTATPPAGSTGVCNDGTYSQAASKSGACRGHKGVKTWYAAAPAAATPAAKTAAAAPAAPAAPAPAAAPAPSPKPAAVAPAMAAKPAASTPASSSKLASMPQAPGGGPGMVWVNTSTKVYHCPTDQYYGKTKQGSYMTESDAKAKGYHADAGKACK